LLKNEAVSGKRGNNPTKVGEEEPMQIQDLIEKLSVFPADTQVLVGTITDGEIVSSLANIRKVSEVEAQPVRDKGPSVRLVVLDVAKEK
jgi:hypothetical protein